MRWRWNSKFGRSLSSRLIFSHVAVTIMVLAIALGISNITFRNYLVGAQVRDLATRGQSISGVMQGYFTGTLYGPEAAYLVSVLQGTLNDRVFVLDDTGQILLETGNKRLPAAPWSEAILVRVLEDGQQFQGVLEGPNHVAEATAGVPVIAHGHIYGAVFLEAPLSNSNHTARSLTGLLLLGEIAAIVMAAILAYGFSKRLAQPLLALRETVSQMGRDNAHEVHAQEQGAQEVRELAQEFNRMADRITSQMHQLRKEAEVRDTLLAHVAHDLRTPLTSIRGFLEAIRDGMVEGEGLKRAVDIAWDETLRLKRLVDRLLAATRIQSGVGDKSLVRVSVWIQTTLDRVAPLAQETQHPLVWRQRDDAEILAIEDYLVEALINIIDNAAKWAPRATPILIDSVLSSDGATIAVSVTDQGPGIPPEMLDHVFERFVTGDKARQGSSGLGLSIVHDVMQQHRGTVTASNNPAGGTVITMTLPTYREAP
ncbi:HAMP domain-containing sensor histidine kinase [Sulfobacillus sp. hq2]|uniref:sensor histidine kinase n=1 Tax=Sulfobacillus sp. hq2 TaxID=2039167 RepID=UPI001FA86F8E|nr:HAMP domain-containing sensor histidine kinase [Sulfobacillus sp. hq2]